MNSVGIAGVMTVDTVAERFASPPGFTESDLMLDLARIEEIDSSGLALLLHWQTLAQRSCCRLRFANCPSKLKDLAGLAGLEGMFD